MEQFPEHVGHLKPPHSPIIVDGLIDLPARDSFEATVDFIAVDWQTAAKRIGRDLVSPAPYKNGGTPVVFEAKWMQRHPKGELIPQLSFSP